MVYIYVIDQRFKLIFVAVVMRVVVSLARSLLEALIADDNILTQGIMPTLMIVQVELGKRAIMGDSTVLSVISPRPSLLEAGTLASTVQRNTNDPPAPSGREEVSVIHIGCSDPGLQVGHGIKTNAI